MTGENFLLAALILGLGALSFLVMRVYVTKLLHKLSKHTKTAWDDIIVEKKVPQVFSYLAPILVFHVGLKYFPQVSATGRHILWVAVLVLFIVLVDRLLSCALAVYQTYPMSARRPLKGHVQLLKIFLYIVGGVTAVCLALDKSPWGILSGIGAVAAVLLLVFKNTILSFVAGIQIVADDLVRKGDWVEMPQYGADGDVIDIALHTIKVQNWDKTIITIPTSKLVEGSFKNWRGMKDAGGRRIKRAVVVDQSSIRFLDEAEIDRFGKIDLIKDYVLDRKKEIEDYNREHGHDRTKSPVNGRAMTNIGTFRAYVVAYLREHPKIHKDMTFMVRQLAPTSEGLPLEIYIFTNDIVWTHYEGIQSNIFDHILAAMPQFGLRAYQRSSDYDSARPD
ncbi:MAG: mechanosensitive ion channel [Thermodesulfobacteriota bacterium]|nr:mechanosensitive ion channel [Thermodesulfobacteriota bacterium]